MLLMTNPKVMEAKVAEVATNPEAEPNHNNVIRPLAVRATKVRVKVKAKAKPKATANLTQKEKVKAPMPKLKRRPSPKLSLSAMLAKRH